MFPRGIPSAALPVAVTSALRPVQPPAPAACEARCHSHPPATSPRTADREAESAPPVPLRFTASRPAAHRPPEEAPHPGLRHRASCLTPCLRPPGTPVATLWELRFGSLFRVVHIGGSRGHLRALRRQALSSSLPALPRSCLTCAAWSFLRERLTPRPAVAKSTCRFCVRKIRCAPALQNIGNGAGESLQSSGAGRSRLGKHGSGRDLLAACVHGFNPPSAFNPSHPPPLAAAARGVAK